MRYESKYESPEVGNSEFTPEKQEQYRALLRMIMTIVAGRSRNAGWSEHFYYFDLYAGTGWTQGQQGSVIIAIEEAQCAGLTLHAWFFERIREPPICSVNLRGLPGELYVIEGDCNETVPQIAGQLNVKARRYGVVYSDGNAPARQPIEAIRSLTTLPCFRRLDVVAYIGATRIKWWARLGSGSSRLIEQLQAVGKQKTIVRKPHGPEQWTFAILTNWGKFPEFTKQGYHATDTTEGRRTLEVLDLTKREIEAKHQPSLDFDGPDDGSRRPSQPYFHLPGIPPSPQIPGRPRPGNEEGRRRV